MPATIEQAIAHCIAQSASGPTFGEGECQMQCRIAYGVPSNGCPDAISDWNASAHKHRTSDVASIPRGAVLAWSGGSAGHGHRAIATGDGECWSTDILRTGRFDKVPISLIHDKWGLTLLGWTEDVDGVIVWHDVIKPTKSTVAKRAKAKKTPNAAKKAKANLRVGRDNSKPTTVWGKRFRKALAALRPAKKK